MRPSVRGLLVLVTLLAVNAPYLLTRAEVRAHGASTAARQGPTLSLRGLAATPGGPISISVQGAGFTPNGVVLVTFNAPYSADGSPLAPRSLPPTIDRPGDNRPLPPGSFIAALNNSIEVVANADGNGAIGLDADFGPVLIQLPPTTIDGLYGVAAVDISSPTTIAFAQFRVRRSPIQALLVLPLAGTSAPLGGALNVMAAPGTFNNGDIVKFFLEDFAASASLGPLNPSSYGVFTGLQPPSVPLAIIRCGAPPAPHSPFFGCQAGADGSVSAAVQMAPASGATPANLLSTTYEDQVYAIVATSVANVLGLPFVNVSVAAGVHLDHGRSGLQVTIGRIGSTPGLAIAGSGFAASSAVAVYAVTTTPGGACPLSQGTAYFSTPCPVGTTNTGLNGTFSLTLGLSSLTALRGTGYLLGEDFVPGTYPGDGAIRLNEAATLSLGLSLL